MCPWSIGTLQRQKMISNQLLTWKVLLCLTAQLFLAVKSTEAACSSCLSSLSISGSATLSLKGPYGIRHEGTSVSKTSLLAFLSSRCLATYILKRSHPVLLAGKLAVEEESESPHSEGKKDSGIFDDLEAPADRGVPEKPVDSKAETATSTSMISAIALYKNFISPLLPPACRFVPTCSQYGVQAIQEFGTSKGACLTAWRLMRCSPFGGRGYDPPRWPPVTYQYGSY